jgi:CHAT domain-containing protein
VRRTSYDIIHFAGHAALDQRAPGSSALRFADALLTANDVLRLPWPAPPYLVFNNACESGRGVGGRRLVSGRSHANGLAAAFLSAGVDAYAGFFWPVSDVGAGIFANEFYRCLFERENVGLAFLAARSRTARELDDVADLAGYGAVLFGDAASAHRRDLATAR